MRPAILLAILLAGASVEALSSQENGPMLGAILLAEDHRAASDSELQLLLRGLSSRDTLVLRRAIRALGRLERPTLAPRIFPLLSHPVAGVRAEAAQAVAQALQGFRGDTGSVRGGSWGESLMELGRRVVEERDPQVRGMLALSLGRLPYAIPAEITLAREQLLALGEGAAGAGQIDGARGMETMARLTARRLPLAEAFVLRLRGLAGDERGDPRARRSALGALLAGQAADGVTLTGAMRSGDAQLRRLALTGAMRLAERETAERLLRAGRTDSSNLVRYEALRAWARFAGRASCTQLIETARGSAGSLALLALDLLGTTCAEDSLAARALETALEESPGAWHRSAHALVSLARLAPAAAARALPAVRSARTWQLRMYAARAALVLRDTGALRLLARDSVANVREAALAALRESTGHADDGLFRNALGARDYQLVLTAATALAGSPDRTETPRALLAALERISAERRETSRDPRVAILVRLRELGGPELAPRLLPYLRDFDPAVADSAAALLVAWTGKPHRASPRRLVPATISRAEVERLRGSRLVVTMESGAAFEIELHVDEAPLSVARVARLAARGYYDGLSLHRVVPAFVVQGGGPGANEYMGDGPYMRDELGALSHERGTLGISTRGRDTGDAQLFINLVDNPRLDYDYTVWGRVASGMDVVDALLEGAIMRRVELRSR